MDFKGLITKDEYVLTNINIINGYPRYVIRLKDEKEYPVLSTLEKSGKTKRKVYFIKKDNEYYRLDEAVKSYYISEKRKYARSGIWFIN